MLYAGVVVETPDGPMLCRCMLLLCSTDLPAKAAVSNMMSFNGQYSYLTCTEKGDNTRGTTAMNRYWLYTPRCDVRVKRNVIAAFSEAVNSGRPVMLLLLMCAHTKSCMHGHGYWMTLYLL